MKAFFAIFVILLIFIVAVKCLIVDNSVNSQFADRKDEHYMILDQVVEIRQDVNELKGIAEENSRKLDFLIDEYQKNVNRDLRRDR